MSCRKYQLASVLFDANGGKNGKMYLPAPRTFMRFEVTKSFFMKLLRQVFMNHHRVLEHFKEQQRR